MVPFSKSTIERNGLPLSRIVTIVSLPCRPDGEALQRSCARKSHLIVGHNVPRSLKLSNAICVGATNVSCRLGFPHGEAPKQHSFYETGGTRAAPRRWVLV
jgi:hypothetical protein